MVSKNTPVMLMSPCFTGSSVSAQAAVMAAEPNPASLEKTLRATPQRRASRRVTIPKAPPSAASGATAHRSIRVTAPGRRRRFPRITASPPPKYSSVITGTSTVEISAMRRMPPNKIVRASAAVTSPTRQRGRVKAAEKVSAKAPDWAIAPIAKAISRANKA